MRKHTHAATALCAFVTPSFGLGAEYGSGTLLEVPVAPSSFGHAVEAFDLEEPTIDSECYQAQVDIYSDQLVAIEATRVILQQLANRVEDAEADIGDNQADL